LAFISLASSSASAATPPATFGEDSTFCSTATPGGYTLGSPAVSFDNVYACGPANNSGKGYYVPASGKYKGFFEDSAWEYQCVELANRFAFDAYGLTPLKGSALTGEDYAATLNKAHPSIPLVKNGAGSKAYLPGDIVSLSDSHLKDGHVAIVIASTESASGNGTITVMQENAPAPDETFAVTKWALQPKGYLKGIDFDALSVPGVTAYPGGAWAIATANSDVWMTNTTGNSVTERNAKTGALIRTLSGGSYGFHSPGDIAFDGTHLWVVNYWATGMGYDASASSITEFDASNGNWVRTITCASCEIWVPDAISAAGTHLWIANQGDGVVDELATSDGSFVQAISDHAYLGPVGYCKQCNFYLIFSLLAEGSNVWVINTPEEGPDDVIELNASTGKWVRTLSGGKYGFDVPSGIAYDGTHLWVTNAGGNSVTEFNASNGHWVRTISDAAHGFTSPEQITADGTHVWIVNSFSRSSITEVNVSNGAVVRKLSGDLYRFDFPSSVVYDGSHLWVANSDSVTAIATS
jgi:hypothetical protein